MNVELPYLTWFDTIFISETKLNKNHLNRAATQYIWFSQKNKFYNYAQILEL